MVSQYAGGGAGSDRAQSQAGSPLRCRTCQRTLPAGHFGKLIHKTYSSSDHRRTRAQTSSTSTRHSYSEWLALSGRPRKRPVLDIDINRVREDQRQYHVVICTSKSSHQHRSRAFAITLMCTCRWRQMATATSIQSQISCTAMLATMRQSESRLCTTWRQTRTAMRRLSNSTRASRDTQYACARYAPVAHSVCRPAAASSAASDAYEAHWTSIRNVRTSDPSVWASAGCGLGRQHGGPSHEQVLWLQRLHLPAGAAMLADHKLHTDCVVPVLASELP